jgi:hypothetical protein
MLLMSRREMPVGAGALAVAKFGDGPPAATYPDNMLRVIVPRARRDTRLIPRSA